MADDEHGASGNTPAAAAASADAMSFMALVGSASMNKPQGFEGPEKRLEVIVRGKGLAAGGFRQAGREEWAEVISILKAQIVNHVHNEFLDAYVLTESSLFVYPHKVILITCGTTVLLNALPAVLEKAEKYGCEVEWASFMRKNFSYPWEQVGPHSSMEAEYATLKSHLPLGRPFIFGPIDSDHYFCFIYDDIHRPCVEADTQISMTMYDFDENVAKCFYSDVFLDGEHTEKIRKATKLDTLVPGWVVQDLQFAPCGYSINAILGEHYQTMHITPESHCSFASYETNLAVASVAEQVTKVLNVFRPQRFSIVVLIDPQSPMGQAFSGGTSLGFKEIEGYTILNESENEFAPGYTMMKVNFVLKGEPAVAAAAA